MHLSGGTIVFPCARHVMLYLVLVQPRKRSDMTKKIWHESVRPVIKESLF